MRRMWQVCLLLCLMSTLARASEETLTFGRFGTIKVYHSVPQPAHVALFVSGDGDGNQGVVDMARELAATDTLVVGVDIVSDLKVLAASQEACVYPASDFEGLSQFIQKRWFPHYKPPVLIGYSSGATLVYAILVQAPPGTFKGALSLGFCPDLALSKPLCKGNGLAFEPGPKGKGVNFLPAARLGSPWIALQGGVDQVCDPPSTEDGS